MAASYTKSTTPIIPSPSPSGRFRNSPSLPASYSSSSRFASSRSTSPTRANIYGCIVPNRSISVVVSGSADLVKRQSHQRRRTCMCAPTKHPGSFRCSLHKSFGSRSVARYSPNRLNALRSAMTNSLVRIRGRALAALIRPSSHKQRRHGVFIPRPSRLSFMTKADKSS